MELRSNNFRKNHILIIIRNLQRWLFLNIFRYRCNWCYDEPASGRCCEFSLPHEPIKNHRTRSFLLGWADGRSPPFIFPKIFFCKSKNCLIINFSIIWVKTKWQFLHVILFDFILFLFRRTWFRMILFLKHNLCLC